MQFISREVLAIFASILLGVNGADWPDFRVNYGLTPTGHFNRMPKIQSEAISAGLRPVNTECTSNGSYLGFRYMDPNDPTLALVYDVNGIIAGIQMLLKQNDILGPNNTFKFGENQMFRNATVGGEEYFVLTAYFVNPDIICTTGRNETDLVSEGTGTGVWIQDGSSFMEIPFLRADAINTGWTNNNCFAGMGTHSWYRMEDWAASNCDVQVPVFGLYNRQMRLHGFGFSVSGTTLSPHFENPPTLAVSLIAGLPAPDCLLDGNDLIGQTTMHVYFIDTPWFISCL